MRECAESMTKHTLVIDDDVAVRVAKPVQPWKLTGAASFIGAA
jgi:hypothetical protein